MKDMLKLKNWHDVMELIDSLMEQNKKLKEERSDLYTAFSSVVRERCITEYIKYNECYPTEGELEEYTNVVCTELLNEARKMRIRDGK